MISNSMKTKIRNSWKARTSTLAAHLLIYLVVRRPKTPKFTRFEGHGVLTLGHSCPGACSREQFGFISRFYFTSFFSLSLYLLCTISFLKSSFPSQISLSRLLGILFITVIVTCFGEWRLFQVGVRDHGKI